MGPSGRRRRPRDQCRDQRLPPLPQELDLAIDERCGRPSLRSQDWCERGSQAGEDDRMGCWRSAKATFSLNRSTRLPPPDRAPGPQATTPLRTPSLPAMGIRDRAMAATVLKAIDRAVETRWDDAVAR